MLLCCPLPSDVSSEYLYRLYRVSPEWRRIAADQRPNCRRLESLAVGALLTLGLLRVGEDVERPVRFNEYGKPYFEGGPCFSLSHSRLYAACAIHNRTVGVDVEDVKPAPRRAALRICTQSELKQLFKAEDPGLYFTCLWALKEAYYKAAGGTPAVSVMRKAQFELTPEGVVLGPDSWRFEIHQLPGAVLAMAAEID